MRALVNTWTSPNRHLYGSVSALEMIRLKELTKNQGAVVEFGTLFGHTALALAGNGATVTTVDNLSWNPFGMSKDEHREFLLRNLTGSNVTFLEGNVETVKVPSPVDMVFIDAKHDYETTAFLLEKAVVLGAKLIVAHDASTEFPGVLDAIRLFEHTEKESYSFTREVGTLWSARARRD